jgi:aryl-alcohol dehydrogenase-like predicted oxidoreductase
VAYSPLCRGLLTDDFDPSKLDDTDFRASLPKFSGDNYKINVNIINQLKLFAKNRNISLSGLALSWLESQNVIVIPGMRKPERALDALLALQFQLTKEDLVKIDEIAYIGAIKGTRYIESAMKAYGFK